MGKFSRDKGARFERQIANLLQDELGIKFDRNLEQCRKDDQGDLVADCENFPFLIEAKCRAHGSFSQTWWRQAYKAACATGQNPAVVYRFDRQPIRVRVQLRAAMECISRKRWSAEDHHQIDIDLGGFAYLCREGLA